MCKLKISLEFLRSRCSPFSTFWGEASLTNLINHCTEASGWWTAAYLFPLRVQLVYRWGLRTWWSWVAVLKLVLLPIHFTIKHPGDTVECSSLYPWPWTSKWRSLISGQCRQASVQMERPVGNYRLLVLSFSAKSSLLSGRGLWSRQDTYS